MNKRESLCYISAWSKSIRVDVSALNKGVKCFTPACKVIIIINDTYNITIRTVINVTIFLSEIRLILWYLEHLSVLNADEGPKSIMLSTKCKRR